MTEPTSPETPRLDPASGQAAVKPAAAGVPSFGEPVPVAKLSPEEQMALFEKELKEKDWGHQPC